MYTPNIDSKCQQNTGIRHEIKGIAIIATKIQVLHRVVVILLYFPVLSAQMIKKLFTCLVA